MIKKLYNKIIMFFNRKDAVVEELCPCEAYTKFKNAKNISDKISKKYSQQIIDSINECIDSAVFRGEFKCVYVYEKYADILREQDRKYIKSHFKNNGYSIKYIVKDCDGKKRTTFYIKWDRWKK